MYVFTCRNQFADMMTCIYEAWASRKGHRNVKLMTEPVGTLELFCEYCHVDADEAKAQSVIRTIKKKISPRGYQMVYRAALSGEEDKLDAIYRFLVLGFHYGAEVLDYLGEPAVMRLFALERKVNNEAHKFREFLRFTEKTKAGIGGGHSPSASCVSEDRELSVIRTAGFGSSMSGMRSVLVGRISPENDILILLAGSFADRMPSENWMIIDEVRMTAAVHPADSACYLTTLTQEERKYFTEGSEDGTEKLWKEFFRVIGIKERKNPKCQRTLMPFKYRDFMTEFR